jgi:hypothetical protein
MASPSTSVRDTACGHLDEAARGLSRLARVRVSKFGDARPKMRIATVAQSLVAGEFRYAPGLPRNRPPLRNMPFSQGVHHSISTR